MHADIIINASRNNTNHLIYIITGSAVGIATLLVVCGLFVAALICITLCSKKSTILSQDRPDLELPVYEYITGPVYEHLDPTGTSMMTENEAYNTCCKEIRDYEIVQM